MEKSKKEILIDRLNQSANSINLHDAIFQHLFVEKDKLIIDSEIGGYHFLIQPQLFDGIFENENQCLLNLRLIFYGIEFINYSFNVENLYKNIVTISNNELLADRTISFELSVDVDDDDNEIIQNIIEFKFKSYKWEVLYGLNK